MACENKTCKIPKCSGYCSLDVDCSTRKETSIPDNFKKKPGYLRMGLASNCCGPIATWCGDKRVMLVTRVKISNIY